MAHALSDETTKSDFGGKPASERFTRELSVLGAAIWDSSATGTS